MCTLVGCVTEAQPLDAPPLDAPPLEAAPSPDDPPPAAPGAATSVHLVDHSITPTMEPPCDDKGECCPPGTSPTLGTPNADILSTADANLCFVALGGADVFQSTAPSDLHAALGGPGNDILLGGFGPAILAGGEGNDTLTSRDDDDELYGGPGNDSLISQAGDDRGFGGPGDDTINLGAGDDEADGGFGNDSLMTASGNDILRGGPGNDILHGGSGADTLYGNAGDDVLGGGTGDDVLVGGPGRDIVHAGTGNDLVIIHDVCEIALGEVYTGGSGQDTLRTPIPLSELQAAGVIVTGFETIEVVVSPLASECGSCSCTLVAGALHCCSDHGTCDNINEDGVQYCDCDEGLLGNDCSYDPEQTFFGDAPPPNCPTGDPSCWLQFDADDACGTIDLLMETACDDMAALLEYKSTTPSQFDMNYCIYYPAAEGVPDTWAPGTYPLMLFNAGNTYSHTHYASLASTLAQNGFITVTMSPDGNSGTVATRGEMLSCLRRLSPGLVAGDSMLGDHLGGRFAYGGHSRGGEAAVVATMFDAENPEIPPTDAVVSLAPNDDCMGTEGGNTCGYDPVIQSTQRLRGVLADGVTRGFLVMEGSRDGDNTGEGTSLFDLTSPETLEEVVPEDAMVKAMLWGFDILHQTWGGSMSRGGLLGKTYALAFLEWHLEDAVARRPLFTGSVLPHCVMDPTACGHDFGPPAIFPQFREGGSTLDGHRKVVRYFEAPLNDEVGSGPVTIFGDVEPVDSNASGPGRHLRGTSLELTAEPGEPASVEFRLDGFGESEPLDTLGASLGVLSFRVARLLDGEIPVVHVGATFEDAQAACDAFTDLPQQNLSDLDLRITLADASASASPPVASATHRRVAIPDIAVVKSPNYNCEVLNFWTTIRIPLTAFTGVDLGQLVSLRIELDTANNGDKHVGALLDTVEFVGHALEPVCGNGVREAGEECDGDDLDGQTCATLGEGDGVLACTDACLWDTSNCQPDCPPGAAGCPCREAPASEGVAAYWQDGRYCDDPLLLCREDAPDAWTCHPCSFDGVNYVGCPCSAEQPDSCPVDLTCIGGLPDLPAIDGDARGACWPTETPPEGYCAELCAATARICGTTVDLPAMCLISDCDGLGYCEFQGDVCDRSGGPIQCVDVCDEFLNPCDPNQICTPWGECWG